jgi:hypothetical protein
MNCDLIAKECPDCGFNFKVADPKNWVCTNCYAREIPKYLVRYRKRSSKKTDRDFLDYKDKELAKLLVEQIRMSEFHFDNSPTHKELVAEICRDLDANNVPYHAPLDCETGNVDIFIDIEPPIIIEAKPTARNHELASALGQLLYYSFTFPKAQLYLALPESVSLKKKYRDIFRLYNIFPWKNMVETDKSMSR